MIQNNNLENVKLNFATQITGNWKETYQWIPIFGAFAAISTVFFVGANNLSAPFSTPIGSGAMNFAQAFITACVIYIPGVTLTSNVSAVNGLFSDFLEARQPDEGFLMWSFVIVLITAAIWLALATYFELPVSSQQSIQCALLGTILVTEGLGYIPIWNKNEIQNNSKKIGLIWIFVEWTVAPLIACFCAFILFTLLRVSVLRHEKAEKRRILVFLPINYGVSAGLLCVFIVYQVIPNRLSFYKWAPVIVIASATLIGAILSLVVLVALMKKKKVSKAKREKAMENNNNNNNININITNGIENTNHDDHQSIVINSPSDNGNGNFEFESALKDYIQMRVLETVHEEDEKSLPNDSPADQDCDSSIKSCADQSAPLQELLQSAPNCLINGHDQSINFRENDETKPDASRVSSMFNIMAFVKSRGSPAIEYNTNTLIRHAQAEKYDEIEELFSFPHILASCIFALVQSASEIAPLLSPYRAIREIFWHRKLYSQTGHYRETENVTEWWYRTIGGFSAAIGFLVYGWRLTRCLGGKLSYVSNSRGLTSQMSTVAVIFAVNKFKLPGSSVHAFVGSLVGVGLADDPKNVNWKLVLKLVSGWILTIVFCCGLAFALFSASLRSPSYFVP